MPKNAPPQAKPAPATVAGTTETKALAPIAPRGLAVPVDKIAESPLDAVVYYAEQARRAAVVGIAYQVLAGMAATQLKKALGVTKGTRSDLANDERLAAGWEPFCKKTLGVSADTVSRWMALAALVAAKLGKLEWLTPEALEQFAHLSADQFAALHKSIKGVVDGKTQQQLLLEWGALAGGAHRGTTPSGDGGNGDGSGSDAKPPGWSDEEWSEWLAADETLRAAIDHVRAFRAAIDAFAAAEKVHPHIPAHYRDEVRVRAMDTLASLQDATI